MYANACKCMHMYAHVCPGFGTQHLRAWAWGGYGTHGVNGGRFGPFEHLYKILVFCGLAMPPHPLTRGGAPGRPSPPPSWSTVAFIPSHPPCEDQGGSGLCAKPLWKCLQSCSPWRCPLKQLEDRSGFYVT